MINLNKFTFFTFFITSLIIISCNNTNNHRIINCTSVGDCKSTQNCKFKSLNSEFGICTDQEECLNNNDCSNNLLCLDNLSKKYCGTRSEFKIKEKVFKDIIRNTQYNEQIEVVNNSFSKYYFKLRADSKLPDGLVLSENGKLSGKVTANSRNYSFVVVAYNYPKNSLYYYNYKKAIKEIKIKVIDADCEMNCSGNSSCDKNTNKCICNTGYKGTNCNECKINFHNKDGICIKDEVCDSNSCTEANKSICKVNSGVITCSCNQGYFGDNCNNCITGYHKVNNNCIIDEVCDSNSCTEPNKSICKVNSGVITCSCNQGYHDLNDNCIVDEVCDSNSCTEANKSICKVNLGIITCSCNQGYHDLNGNCIIDEVCDSNSCTEPNKGICNIINGITTCSCNQGYYNDNGTCTQLPTIDWCNTQWPETINSNNIDVFGRVYVENITSLEGKSNLLSAQLCYFSDEDTINNSTCINAIYNKDVQNTNKDEYKASLSLLQSGTYHYYYQFKINGTNKYKKCDLNNRTTNIDGTNYQNNDIYQSDTGTANVVIENTGNLFISEYIEGKGDNKFIELYTSSGSTDLSGWKIKLATNGATEFSTIIELNPLILNAETTYVIANNGALGFSSNQVSNLLAFNGNDVIGLFNPTGDLIDIIGTLGDRTNFAKDKRLIRKPYIIHGATTYIPVNWLLSNITNTENQENNLGTHNCITKSK